MTFAWTVKFLFQIPGFAIKFEFLIKNGLIKTKLLN